MVNIEETTEKMMKAYAWIPLMMLLCASCEQSDNKLDLGKAMVVPTQDGSNVKGLVLFEETNEGLKVRADLTGVPPGKHGIHIHEFGDIGNNGNNAGGHYNPNNTKHGFIIKDGFEQAHAGDFGNIEADESGHATLTLVIPGLSLNQGKYNISGRAIIIHEKEDDFGQPTGNAGSRIGGGTIMIVGKEILQQN